MTVHTVTLNQLESHLWEAANILRGPVDAADFKTYVFPLLFFKRISDVHDEEYADGARGVRRRRGVRPLSRRTTASRSQKVATGVMCER